MTKLTDSEKAALDTLIAKYEKEGLESDALIPKIYPTTVMIAATIAGRCMPANTDVDADALKAQFENKISLSDLKKLRESNK